jgi:hypothetical protein
VRLAVRQGPVRRPSEQAAVGREPEAAEAEEEDLVSVPGPPACKPRPTLKDKPRWQVEYNGAMYHRQKNRNPEPEVFRPEVKVQPRAEGGGKTRKAEPKGDAKPKAKPDAEGQRGGFLPGSGAKAPASATRGDAKAAVDALATTGLPPRSSRRSRGVQTEAGTRDDVTQLHGSIEELRNQVEVLVSCDGALTHRTQGDKK